MAENPSIEIADTLLRCRAALDESQIDVAHTYFDDVLDRQELDPEDNEGYVRSILLAMMHHCRKNPNLDFEYELSWCRRAFEDDLRQEELEDEDDNSREPAPDKGEPETRDPGAGADVQDVQE